MLIASQESKGATDPNTYTLVIVNPIGAMTLAPRKNGEIRLLLLAI